MAPRFAKTRKVGRLRHLPACAHGCRLCNELPLLHIACGQPRMVSITHCTPAGLACRRHVADWRYVSTVPGSKDPGMAGLMGNGWPDGTANPSASSASCHSQLHTTLGIVQGKVCIVSVMLAHRRMQVRIIPPPRRERARVSHGKCCPAGWHGRSIWECGEGKTANPSQIGLLEMYWFCWLSAMKQNCGCRGWLLRARGPAWRPALAVLGSSQTKKAGAGHGAGRAGVVMFKCGDASC